MADQDQADDVWLTRDGRAIPLGDMYFNHIGNAKASLTKWLKRETDPAQRADLKSWQRRFRKEVAKRAKEWRARNARKAD